eukprot:gene14170-19012_t
MFEANEHRSKKKLKQSFDEENNSLDLQAIDDTENREKLYNIPLPMEVLTRYTSAIFELGLRHSSPKLIMALMPQCSELNTEHIKSHLQKYRIHNERSREEFILFYNTYMKESLEEWENRQGWNDVDQVELSNSSVKYKDQSEHGKFSNSQLNIGSIDVEVNVAILDQSNIQNNSVKNTDLSSHINNSQLNRNIGNKRPLSTNELLKQSELLLFDLHNLCKEIMEDGNVVNNEIGRYLSTVNNTVVSWSSEQKVDEMSDS